jgi:hypothetical protein
MNLKPFFFHEKHESHESHETNHKVTLAWLNHSMRATNNYGIHLNMFVSFASFHLVVKCLLTPFRAFRGQLGFPG